MATYSCPVKWLGETPPVLVHCCGSSELPAARHARRELDLDAGFDLEVGRAPAAAIDGGLGFEIGVPRVAAFQLDHLAEAEPNGDNIGVGVTVELHDGVRAKVPSMLEVVVQDRLHRDQLRDRKSTRLNSSHLARSRMPSSA